MNRNEAKLGHAAISKENAGSRIFAQHLCAYEFVKPYVQNKDLLEIGFGEGYGVAFLSQFAHKIIAVDLLQDTVERAKQKYKQYENIEFLRMDSSHLTFDNNSFDVVLSFQVIEHIPNPDRETYLSQIKRVVKAGGIVFITTPNLRWMNKKLYNNRLTDYIYCKNPYHQKEYMFDEFHNLMQKDFSKVQIYGLFPSWSHKIFSRLKKIGISNLLPGNLNLKNRFYHKITPKDFVWNENNIDKAIDFMAVCQKC